MKHFILVSIFLVTFFHQGFGGVWECYKCSGAGNTCEDESTLTKVSCDTDLPGYENYLCRSKKEGGTTTKDCIPNQSTSINECDDMNRDDNDSTSCYLCDRELCNSAFSIKAFIPGVFFLMATHYVLRIIRIY